MGKPILCLDFDGVLHSYTSGWKGANVVSDPPVEGATLFLAEAVEKFEVHVFSSRSNQEGGIEAMRKAITLWVTSDFDYDRATYVISEIKYPTEKPPAMVSIDDRAITFEGKWPAMDTLLQFKPWNKRV